MILLRFVDICLQPLLWLTIATVDHHKGSTDVKMFVTFFVTSFWNIAKMGKKELKAIFQGKQWEKLKETYFPV